MKIVLLIIESVCMVFAWAIIAWAIVAQRQLRNDMDNILKAKLIMLDIASKKGPLPPENQMIPQEQGYGR